MSEEINFYYEYYKPLFEEGCRIWIDGIMPYLEVREDKSIWFCPPIVKEPVPGTAPDTSPVRVMEGIPEHNYFCPNGCDQRLEYDGRLVKCKSCEYLNTFRKYLANRQKLIRESILKNSENTLNQLKMRRWINGEEVECQQE